MRKILVSFDNRRAITMSALLILTAAAFCTNVIAEILPKLSQRAPWT